MNRVLSVLMAKIVRLRTGDNLTVHDFIENLYDAIDDFGVTQIVVSAKTRDGEVLTGWVTPDLPDRLYLISHLQADIHKELAGVDLDG